MFLSAWNTRQYRFVYWGQFAALLFGPLSASESLNFRFLNVLLPTTEQSSSLAENHQSPSSPFLCLITVFFSAALLKYEKICSDLRLLQFPGWSLIKPPPFKNPRSLNLHSTEGQGARSSPGRHYSASKRDWKFLFECRLGVEDSR